MNRRTRSWQRAGALAFLLAVSVVLIVLVIKWVPQWLASTKGLDEVQRVEELGRVRTALLALLAGVVAVVGAVYAARTFALNRQGQITDRFTRAVDQLGHKELDVRLGGIYALERLAHESCEYHGPIVEILTAFVREHAPWPPRADAPGPSADRTGSISVSAWGDENDPGPSTDVQAVLTVLGRRTAAHDAATTMLELSKTALSRALFTGGYWKRTVLHETNLERAVMVNARLDDAILLGANLKGALLMRASLKGALLDSANLEGAMLHGANLYGASLGAGPDDVEVTLRGACYDSETKWPKGFDPEAHGAVLVTSMHDPEATP